MRNTQTFASYTALLAILQSIKVADTNTANPMDVFDGPMIEQTELKRYFQLGVQDPDSDTEDAVVSAVQDWLGLGAFDRDETFTINGLYVCWDGGTSFTGLRADAEAQMDALRIALRKDPLNPTGSDGQLGTSTTPGPLGPTGWCGLTVGGFTQATENNRVEVRTPFSVYCFTRI